MFVVSGFTATAQSGFYKRAIQKYEEGNLVESKEYIDYYLKKHDDASAWNFAGKVHAALKEIDASRKAFHKASIHADAQPEYMLNLVKSAVCTDSVAMALEWCNKYLHLKPDDRDVHDLWNFLTNEFSRDPDSSIVVEYLKFNSDAPDFGAVLFGNGLIFASQRPNSDAGITFWAQSNKLPLLDLYYVEKNQKGNWKSPHPLAGNLNSRFHEGPVSMLADSGGMAYFRCLPKDKKGGGNQLYMASFEKGKWIEEGRFEIGKVEGDLGQACFSPDGQTMWMSIRMAGGQGGYDLYTLTNNNGRWENLQNAGDVINSSGNEVFPFVAEDGTLFFSSDGHPGYGGLDLFKSIQVGNRFKKPHNLGRPMNSNKDDFSLSLMVSDTVCGYFASNRADGGLNDDIYYFSYPEPEFDDCEPMVMDVFCYDLQENNLMQALPPGLYLEWDFGDGSREAGKEVSHCYDLAGEYHVRLNVVDSTTGQPVFAQSNYTLNIENTPQLAFEVADTAATDSLVGLVANLSYIPEFEGKQFYWEFGDGTRARGEKTHHVFPFSGDYVVRLGVVGTNINTGEEEKRCITREINIIDNYVPRPQQQQENVESIAATVEGLFNINDIKDPRFRVQLGTSDEWIEPTPNNFNGLTNVEALQDGEVFRYLMGNEERFDSAYSILVHVRENGYEKSMIMAFENDSLVSVRPTNQNELKLLASQIEIAGKIRVNKDSAVTGNIFIEDLGTGQMLKITTVNDAEAGFNVSIPRVDRIGLYAETDKGFSISQTYELSEHQGKIVLQQDLEVVTVEEMIRTGQSVPLNNVLFQTGSYKLQRSSFKELYRLVRFLHENKNVGIEIAGHTDNVGGDLLNLELSNKRAAQVAKTLAINGISPERLHSVGYGSYRPIADNNTTQGRKLNRRVEFRLVPISTSANNQLSNRFGP